MNGRKRNACDSEKTKYPIATIDTKLWKFMIAYILMTDESQKICSVNNNESSIYVLIEECNAISLLHIIKKPGVKLSRESHQYRKGLFGVKFKSRIPHRKA